MAPSEVNHLSRPYNSGNIVSPYGERKTGLMGWIGKIFKGDSSDGLMTGQHPKLVTEENRVRHAPFVLTAAANVPDDRFRLEDDEFNRAIAISLTEISRKPTGYRRPVDIDDDLARALHESMNMSSHHPYRPTQSFLGEYRICRGCNRDIGSGHYLSCLGGFWHPGCFRCHACARPIAEQEFSLSERNPYHKSCFKELHHPKCDVCHQFIPVNRSGLIEYRSHPFWSQKYCPSHEHDNTARCCSCERLESWNERIIALGDGRNLCFECVESAIMDTGDCQPLYHAIRDFYEGMNMKIDQEIPMLLVERQALNEAVEGEKNGHYHMLETRGLCLSEEQTVSSILRRPRIGGNQLIGMRIQPQKLIRRCEVTAILILYGLPRLLTGSILAHELMHGWLRLQGYRNLSPEVEEGICQVLAYMWLQSEFMPGSRSIPSTSATSSSRNGVESNVEKKLGEFFMSQIANDTSTVYGRGFRAANAAVSKYGLRWTLDYIRRTATFPF